MSRRTSPRTALGLQIQDFATIYDDHSAAVLRYLVKRIGSVSAPDVHSQTFVTALEQRASYDPQRGEILSWLLGIATNLIRRHARTEAAHLRVLARQRGTDLGTTNRSPGVSDVAEAAVAAVWGDSIGPRLAVAVAELRADDRDLLLLFAWGELSYPELAAALGIPIGTVRSRLARARARLRDQLEDLSPQLDEEYA